LVSIYPE